MKRIVLIGTGTAILAAGVFILAMKRRRTR